MTPHVEASARAATDRLRLRGPSPRSSGAAITASVVQREFVRHLQQCHRLRAKLHDGGALCQVLTAMSQELDVGHVAITVMSSRGSSRHIRLVSSHHMC